MVCLSELLFSSDSTIGGREGSVISCMVSRGEVAKWAVHLLFLAFPNPTLPRLVLATISVGLTTQNAVTGGNTEWTIALPNGMQLGTGVAFCIVTSALRRWCELTVPMGVMMPKEE